MVGWIFVQAGGITGPEILGLVILAVFLLCGLVLLAMSTLRFVPYVKDHLPTNLPHFKQEWEASWEGHTIILRRWVNLLATDGGE
jgi:hypothetical protein